MVKPFANGSAGSLVAKVLAGSWRIHPPPLEISPEELARVAPLLLESGAASLGWRQIRNSALGATTDAGELQQAYRLHTLQAGIHERDIKAAVTMFKRADIEPVLVKGWSVARLYPERGLRPYGDIDLCFRPDQFDEVEAALATDEGKKFNIDLHKGFAKLDGLGFEELYARTEVVRLGDVEVRILGAEDHFRILCVHLLRHSAWRPLWLCDIAVALESRPASFDWDRCLGRNSRQADWVACTVGLAHSLLGAKIDDTPVAARAANLPRWLIPSVLRNWDKPDPYLYPPLSYVPPMVTYFRRPAGFFKALRRRWPDPIEASIRMKAPFNEMPRLPFQIGNVFARIFGFFAILVGAREEQVH
ncbi:MAG TPA: nucleotidyltransferase family protein [Blastocatellia bacterium]|nr:nucleotidyltransferase family protein [Blastocatellia bacterium]